MMMSVEHQIERRSFAGELNMSRQNYRTGQGYRRLPWTMAVTIICGLSLIVGGGQVMRMRERRAEYLGLAAKYSELALKYTQRSQDDLDAAVFGEESVPDLEKMVRSALADGEKAEAEAVRKTVGEKKIEVEQLRAQAHKWTDVAGYYRSLGQQFLSGAERPWAEVQTPVGDALDVEGVFLSDQKQFGMR
jgi:hypothetical protein